MAWPNRSWTAATRQTQRAAESSLLGHRRLEITAEYVAVDLEELRSAVKLLEPRGT